MKCNDREKLFLFVHHMLQPVEAEAVRLHLGGCAECARAADEYREFDAALDDWRAAEPSPWFDARVRARVAASAEKGPAFLGFGRGRVLAAVVAAILLIVGALVVFNHPRVAEINHPPSSQQQAEATAAAPQTTATIQGSRQPLPAEDQLRMDENLSLLEDYEVVANFDALSELPQANAN